jgi:gas vesicle protein
MADHDNVPYIVIERHSGGASPFLWGLLMGAGAALLFAPRSGEQTQEEIRRRARQLRSAAEQRVDSVRGSVSDTVARTRSQFQDRIDGVRETVEARAQQAREAMDSSRRVATDAGSEIRRRVEHAREELNAATAAASRDPAVSPRPTSAPSPRAGDMAVTDVDVEEAEGRPGLG